MRVNYVSLVVLGGMSFTSILLLANGETETRGKKMWFTQCHIVNLQLHIVVLAPVFGAKNGSLASCSPNGRVNSNVSAVFTFSFPQAGVQMMCVTCSDIWEHRKKPSLLLEFTFLSLKILKVCPGCLGFWRGTLCVSVLGDTSCFCCFVLPSLCLLHRQRQIYLPYDILWSCVK